MPRRPQEDPNPPDVWLIGLKLVLAASATALISDAPTPVVATVTLGALLVFAVVSSARRRNHSLATALAVLAGHRLAVALSVTTVLLLICAAYLVGVRKERDANSNLAGRVLLRVVSPELRPSCSPLDDSAAVAAIDCTDRGAGVGIRFLQFASFRGHERGTGPARRDLLPPPGGCFTQAIAIGSYSLHGEEAGRLWCDALDERQRLAWTERGTPDPGQGRTNLVGEQLADAVVAEPAPRSRPTGCVAPFRTSTSAGCWSTCPRPSGEAASATASL